MVFLVEHHLTMSQVAQKQDLSDPDVIRAFAALVGDERHLTALYLLTVADIRGTSPKVWNAWKGKLLEDLYQITAARAGRRAALGRPRTAATARSEALRHAAPVRPAATGAHEALWKQLDVAYFLRHDAVRHRLADARAVRQARQRRSRW